MRALDHRPGDGREPRQFPFRDFGRRVGARVVCGLDHPFRNEVEGAFPGLLQVAGRVLDVVPAFGYSQGKDERRVADDLEVGEGSEVCAKGRLGRNQCDGAWGNCRGHEFVVVGRGVVVVVRVESKLFVFLPGFLGVTSGDVFFTAHNLKIVGSISSFPTRIRAKCLFILFIISKRW